MGYERQDFVNGQVLKSEHMNHIEDGIQSVEAIASQKTSIHTAQVDLTVSGWGEGIVQEVTVSGVTATSPVWVTADPASHKDYNRAEIRCFEQKDGRLVFIASILPDKDLKANVCFFS